MQAKERKADFEGVITYLNLYANTSKDDDVKKEADAKLAELRARLNAQMKTPQGSNNALHSEQAPVSLPPSR